MAWNWKKFIILSLVWIISIIIAVRALIPLLITIILYAWGIKKIKEDESLKDVYISFIILISAIYIFNLFIRIFLPDMWYSAIDRKNYENMTLSTEFDNFYNDVFLEELYYGEIKYICMNKGLVQNFLILCKYINNNTVFTNAVIGCKEYILTSTLCSKNETWHNYFFNSCFQILEQRCERRVWYSIFPSICSGDYQKVCNNVYYRFCNDNELERYCKNVIQKVCSLDLEKYCKDLET